MNLVAKAEYLTSCGITFLIEIFHEKYKRSNRYKLYRSGEVCAEGSVPRTYTPRDIFNHWVRDEGTLQTFKLVGVDGDGESVSAEGEIE